MIPEKTLEQVSQRFKTLEDELTLCTDPNQLAGLSKEYAELRPVVARFDDYRELLEEIEETEGLRSDPEFREMAELELQSLRQRLETTVQEVREALVPRDADDDRPAIVEIRAGAGGDEAALFVGDLLRVYEKYAAGRNWKFNIMNSSPLPISGFKSVVAEVRGRAAYSRLKFESGVHRVQRVPTTESRGRIHTSTVTVAVLPEAEEVDIHVDPEDLRIDTMRASGAGGQHVNKTDSAVRLTHLPTGIVIVCSEKSQHRNRATAMSLLRARLYERERQRADKERAESRRSQVGTGDRSERIRTYNFPQGRITDHRIGLTLYKLEQVLEGEIDQIVDALATDDRARRLGELD